MAPPPRLLVLALASALAAAAGCASHGPVVARPFPTPARRAPAPAPAPIATTPGPAPGPTAVTPLPSPLSRAIVESALELTGTPYRDRGEDPGGFDCSGLVTYVFGRHGIRLPRNVAAQYAAGWPVAPGDVAAGDLLFFMTTGPGATHVGIAIGDGTFVHSPSGRGRVRTDRLDATYWAARFLGARRVATAASGL